MQRNIIQLKEDNTESADEANKALKSITAKLVDKEDRDESYKKIDIKN